MDKEKGNENYKLISRKVYKEMEDRIFDLAKEMEKLHIRLSESMHLTELANPDCDKCHGTGRSGYTQVKGFRRAVLCTGKRCSHDILAVAFHQVRNREREAKKEKYRAMRIQGIERTRKERELKNAHQTT